MMINNTHTFAIANRLAFMSTIKSIVINRSIKNLEADEGQERKKCNLWDDSTLAIFSRLKNA